MMAGDVMVVASKLSGEAVVKSPSALLLLLRQFCKKIQKIKVSPNWISLYKLWLWMEIIFLHSLCFVMQCRNSMPKRACRTYNYHIKTNGCKWGSQNTYKCVCIIVFTLNVMQVVLSHSRVIQCRKYVDTVWFCCSVKRKAGNENRACCISPFTNIFVRRSLVHLYRIKIRQSSPSYTLKGWFIQVVLTKLTVQRGWSNCL